MNHQFMSRYCIGIGLLALAGAIIYFSYVILYTVKTLPENLAYLKGVSADLVEVAAQVQEVNEQVPVVVERIDQVQVLIPQVLQEVEAVRLAVPPILQEISATRGAIPPLMNQIDRQLPEVLSEVSAVRTEVSAWREEVPGLKVEGKAYRNTVAMAIAESEHLRTDLPVMLTRVETIVDDVQDAGQKASEGAVTGVITGVFKAPFSLINHATGRLLSGFEAETSDLKMLREVVNQAASGEIGQSYPWHNKKTSRHGEIIVIEDAQRAGRSCRKMQLTAFEKKKKLSAKDFWLCRNQSGDWEYIEE